MSTKFWIGPAGNPFVRGAFLFAIMLGIFALGDLIPPREDGIAWGRHAYVALTFVVGLVAGPRIAARRYGWEAVRDPKHPRFSAASYVEVGVLAGVAAVGMIIGSFFVQVTNG